MFPPSRTCGIKFASTSLYSQLSETPKKLATRRTVQSGWGPLSVSGKVVEVEGLIEGSTGHGGSQGTWCGRAHLTTGTDVPTNPSCEGFDDRPSSAELGGEWWREARSWPDSVKRRLVHPPRPHPRLRLASLQRASARSRLTV